MLTTETLGHKGIFCPIIVKAKMNGSYVTSLDNYDAKAGGRLQVLPTRRNESCLNNYFITRHTLVNYPLRTSGVAS
jgi:hypothetical protein